MFFKDEIIEPLDKEWEKEWKNMPEFTQNDIRPYRTIYIHFLNEEDVKEFGKRINQKITSVTKSLWFPEEDANKILKLIYVDEENV